MRNRVEAELSTKVDEKPWELPSQYAGWGQQSGLQG